VNPKLRTVLALLGVGTLACATTGCAGRAGLFQTVCFIQTQSGSVPYVGPDGRAAPLTAPECAQKNQEAHAAQEQWAVMQEQERSNRQIAAGIDAAIDQAKQEAVLRKEAAAGYKRVTVKDLYLDGKSFAANQTRVSAFGFYKQVNRRDERLYNSYDEYMQRALNGLDALYVGIITEGGSREMRAALLTCPGGCGARLLGHVARCVETNALGRTADDICLVAEDISPESY